MIILDKTIFFIAGNAPVLPYLHNLLHDAGIQIASQPEPDVTHLLLPVPSFEADGRIKGGGILEHILADLPDDVTVIGGNMHHPALQNYHTIDLLQENAYLAENAAITADCAIRVAGSHLKTVFRHCPVLVIGWGRIGKCLATILKAMQCDVIVAARKDTDLNTLRSLGFSCIPIKKAAQVLPNIKLVFNTVPAPIFTQEDLAHCPGNCVLIDLASQPGMFSNKVIQALALPGKHAPQAPAPAQLHRQDSKHGRQNHDRWHPD